MPDEKLRTYFYQGRIHDNREEYDRAIQCFIWGGELQGYTDTLTYGHLLIVEARMYALIYQMGDQLRCCMDAARIYGKIGAEKQQFASSDGNLASMSTTPTSAYTSRNCSCGFDDRFSTCR